MMVPSMTGGVVGEGLLDAVVEGVGVADGHVTVRVYDPTAPLNPSTTMM